MEKFYDCKDAANGLKLWGLPDRHAVRPFVKMTLPSIKVDQPFLIDFDGKWLPAESKNSTSRTYAEVAAGSPVLAEPPVSPGPSSSAPLVAPMSNDSFLIPQGYLNSKSPIRLRLISAKRRDFKTLAQPDTRRQSGNSFVPLAPLLSNSLVFHVHGGGFVACSSFTHTTNTRAWAIDTDAPILSVDYRLAPAFSFPIQLTECVIAYKWALANMSLLGSTGERIIVVGDSSGGNLVTGLIIKAITEGFRVPDAAILIYPAMYLAMSLSCARVISVVDPMLNLKMLHALLPAYIPSDYGVENYYVSPALVPDSILAQFPPTRILAGQCDPLLDDSIYFYQRLKELRVDAEIVVFARVSHGFLNLNAIVVEADDAITLVSLWLLELMGHPVKRTLVSDTPPIAQTNTGAVKQTALVVSSVPGSSSGSAVALPVDAVVDSDRV